LARCHTIQKNLEALLLPRGGRMRIYVVPEHVLTSVDEVCNNATHALTSRVGFDSMARMYGKSFQEAGEAPPWSARLKLQLVRAAPHAECRPASGDNVDRVSAGAASAAAIPQTSGGHAKE
jgi:hypothetical protein